MTPEGKVKAKVNRRLTDHYGHHCYRFMPVQNGMGKPGLDYFCCIKGLHITIETKVEGKDLTERQKTTRDELLEAGGTVFTIHNEDEIDAMIAEIDTMLKHSIIRRVLPRDVK